jgi:chitodextrinase
MTTVAQMPDGKFILTYEIMGTPSGAYYKISDDPENFNPTEPGICFDPAGSGPYVVNLNGTIILSSGGNSNLYINTNNGIGGWEQISSPIGACYSRCLVPLQNGRLFVINAGWNGSSLNKVTCADMAVVPPPQLSDIKLDGITLNGFTPTNTGYSLLLPSGATTVPTITATAAPGRGTITSIVPASSIPGTTTISVNNGTETRNYTVSFGFAPTSSSFMDGTIDSGWTILKENKATYSVVAGKGLILPTQRYDIYSNNHAAWENVFTRPAAGDWDAVSKVYYPNGLVATYQQQALLAWQDEDNYVKISCQSNGTNGKVTVGIASEKGGTYTGGASKDITTTSGAAININYKLVKVGSTYTGYYSTDGVNYTLVGSVTAGISPNAIGIFATRNSTNGSVDTYCKGVDVVSLSQPYGSVAPTWTAGSTLTASDVTSTATTLKWPAAKDEKAVTGYRIYNGSILITTVPADVLSYTVTGLTPKTAYTFKVEAVDGDGAWSTSGPSIQITTLNDNTPPAEDKTSPVWPEGSKLTSSNITSNGLTVIWTPAQDNTAVAGYKVYNGPELIATVNGAAADHYDITGLTANTAYTFKVEAGDAAGNWSTNGPSVSVTTAAGGSSSSGYIPPNKETPATQTTPVTNVTPATDGATVKDGVITVQSKVTDSVVSAEVSKDTIDKALSSSQVAKIVVPAANGAKEYVQTLPVSSLQAADSSKKIVIETPAGTAVVPVNALKAEAIQQKTVDISLAASGSAALSQGLKDQIGNRPVVDVSIKAGSSNIAISNPLTPVTVSIDYKPTADELKDSEHIVVWSIDNNGESVPVTSGKYDAATGKVTFTATESGKYAVTYVEKTFEDTAKTKWAEKPIEVLASKGIAGGTSATTFSPEKSITRADYLTMLMKALGLKSDVTAAFDDVKQDAYYFNAVATAKMLGITDGTGDNKFSPDKLISRQDMIVMTEKALKVAKEIAQNGSGTDLDKFSDKSDISGYAVDSIAGFVNAGLISGSDGKINPRQNTTRAEAAVIIYKIYNK